MEAPARRWVCAPWQPALQAPLIEALAVPPVVAQLLVNRGIRDPDIARRFLAPQLADIPDPFGLPDMALACQRLLVAIRDGEAVVIYGDYDVDGTSATAVIFEALRHYGARVSFYLPDRERDGYGLQPEPLARLIDAGARLVITCDNGTSAHDAIHLARSRGVDVIVTDHHSLPDPLPDALAVINPLRPESDPRWRGVCGAGLAFGLALGLRVAMRDAGHADHPNMRRSLDLVTLGTIADVVPLTGVNRTLVWHGLRELARRERPGLAALLKVSAVGPSDPIDAQTVGFRLGPRLNAAGRLASATTSVRLLITQDAREAQALAGELEDLNQERRRIEDHVLHEVWAALARARVSGDRSAYVLAGEGWHPGVIGIVAARVVDATHRPALIIAHRDGVGRGSGRSVAGVDLFQALSACGDLMVRYGGHPMAAGLTIEADRIPELAQRFEAACGALIGPTGYAPSLPIDAWLEAADIDMALVKALGDLGPFGPENPEPVFATGGLEVSDRRVVGQSHLRLRLRAGQRYYGAIGFRMAEFEARIPGTGGVAVAHSLELNTWQGRTSVQLRLRDLCDPAQVERDAG